MGADLAALLLSQSRPHMLSYGIGGGGMPAATGAESHLLVRARGAAAGATAAAGIAYAPVGTGAG